MSETSQDSDFRRITSVAIIGAGGQMGGMFAARSLAAGLDVRAMDRPLTPEKLRQGIQGADLLLLSVPAAAMDEVLELAAPFLKPPQILADVVSVKVLPLASMLRHYDGPVVGTHPLFGAQSAGRPARCSDARTPGPERLPGQ